MPVVSSVIVMAGLDPAICRSKRFGATRGAFVRVASDGRIKSGHDDLGFATTPVRA
jgi:hypothetical protein